jgi:hypothetical protein
MTFKPAPFAAAQRGLLTLAALALGEALLLLGLLALPTSGFTFLLLVLALGLLVVILFLSWRAWVCLSLQYWIDRNAVTVVWGPLRQVIPLSAITEVRRGGVEPAAHWLDRWPRMESWLLFGKELNMVHRWHAPDPMIGAPPDGATIQLLSLASRPVEQQLLLATSHGIFGVSPQNPDAFLQALEAHHQLGPTHLLAVRRIRPQWLEAALWQDSLGLSLLSAGLLGSLLLLGTLLLRYLALPAQIERLDGAPTRTLFLIPAFGFVVWLLNGLWGMLVYPRQRVAATLLWAGTLVVQLAALAALLSLTG